MKVNASNNAPDTSRVRWRVAQAAEITWWKRYLRHQDAAEYLPRKKQYWLRFLSDIGVQPKAEDTILDAGCGPSGIFMALEGYSVDAVDPLLDAYANELSLFFAPSFYPQVQFVKGTLETLPNKQYSLVFCCNAINHVDNWALSFERLLSAVTPEGLLVLTTDVHRRKWLRSIFRLAPGDILHPQQHVLSEYEAFLSVNNFELIKKPIRLKREFIFDYYALVVQKRSV